jgi:hypothetical protein
LRRARPTVEVPEQPITADSARNNHVVRLGDPPVGSNTVPPRRAVTVDHAPRGALDSEVDTTNLEEVVVGLGELPCLR